MKKLSIIITLAALLMTACKERPYDTVFSTWPNGAKKLVFTVVEKKDGTVERLAEKMYYDNGKPMYEKHFDGDKPSGEWRFWYDNGKLFAMGTPTADDMGKGWTIYNNSGEVYHPEAFDSMVVLQFTDDQRPLSVSYFKDGDETRYQFNDNYTLNAKGKVKNGKKEGRWEFFYANGQKMLEATYIGGVENGAYNSYRENGVPYYRGFYINGKRANIWEVYDEEGNLVERKDFDEH